MARMRIALPLLFLSLAGAPADAPAYRDHSRLLGVIDDAGRERPVETKEDWDLRRQHILAGMQQAMGKLPDRSNLPPLDVRVTAESKGDGFTQLTLSYVAEENDRVPALLLLPDPLPKDKRLPAVL